MATGKRRGVKTEKGDEGNDGCRSINVVGSTVVTNGHRK